MTEYIVAQKLKNGSWFELLPPTKNKAIALRDYSRICEKFPLQNYRVIKRITTEETIAESEDVRQARFDFAE